MEHPELDTLRNIATALPDVTERVSHGAPCFYVSRKALAYFHSTSRLSLWCPVGGDYQTMKLFARPDRFFSPATSQSGHFRDWLGMYLDDIAEEPPDWAEVRAVLIHAYCRIASKRQRARLQDSASR